MDLLQNLSPQVWLLIGSAVMLIIAALSASSAMGESLLRRSFGFSVASAGMTLGAACLGQADVVLATTLGSAVCALALGIGTHTLWGRATDLSDEDRRGWALMLPVALVALMMGFQGRLSLNSALILLLLAGGVLPVFTEQATPHLPEGEPEAPAQQPPPHRVHRARLVLAILLAGLAGWGATHAATQIGATTRGLSPSMLAGSVLATVSVIPILLYAMMQTNPQGIMRGIGAMVVTSMINICLILPLAILIWHVRQKLPMSAIASTTAPVDTPAVLAPMPFPLGIWRVESVMVVILGVAIMPIAIGRMKLGQAHGTALLGAYVIYLVMVRARAALWG